MGLPRLTMIGIRIAMAGAGFISLRYIGEIRRDLRFANNTMRWSLRC